MPFDWFDSVSLAPVTDDEHYSAMVIGAREESAKIDSSGSTPALCFGVQCGERARIQRSRLYTLRNVELRWIRKQSTKFCLWSSISSDGIMIWNQLVFSFMFTWQIWAQFGRVRTAQIDIFSKYFIRVTNFTLIRPITCSSTSTMTIRHSNSALP